MTAERLFQIQFPVGLGFSVYFRRILTDAPHEPEDCSERLRSEELTQHDPALA